MRHILLVAAPVCAAFVAEAIVAGAKNSSFLAMTRGFRRTHLADVACFVAYGLSFFRRTVIIGSFGTSLLFGFAAHLAWKNLLFAYRLDTHDAAVNLALYFVSVSFLTYWVHRAFHSGWLWNFHRFHHSTTEMNPLVKHRDHPMYHAVVGAFVSLPFLVIAVRFEYLVALRVLQQFHEYVFHSNIRSNWGWLGRWVLVSPSAHRLHHSIDARHHDRNFSNDLIIWDRLFGTYCDDFAGVRATGVSDAVHNRHGPIHDVLADYGRALRLAYMLRRIANTPPPT